MKLWLARSVNQACKPMWRARCAAVGARGRRNRPMYAISPKISRGQLTGRILRSFRSRGAARSKRGRRRDGVRARLTASRRETPNRFARTRILSPARARSSGYPRGRSSFTFPLSRPKCGCCRRSLRSPANKPRGERDLGGGRSGAGRVNQHHPVPRYTPRAHRLNRVPCCLSPSTFSYYHNPAGSGSYTWSSTGLPAGLDHRAYNKAQRSPIRRCTYKRKT
jgi:hypothetical protein